MEQNDFWDDPTNSKQVIERANKLKSWTVKYEEAKKRIESVDSIYPELASLSDDELLEDTRLEIDRIEALLEDLEIRKMLSGELDSRNCFLSINAGAGGTEACDWVDMLSRMYQKWASRRGWKIEVVDALPGEVAGIKNITLSLQGDYAYGYAKAEQGVHRLVRISPFDSNRRRHTSFASVEVSPEVADDIQIAVRPDDIRIDTFRSSGAGGQHVNTTDSGVRITHHPSGIVVSCQSERSQLQNKETCMKLLRSKLYELEVHRRESALKELSGEKKEIAWGSQIRNYVFHPYTLVKDARTKWEAGDIQKVMDGDIDPFIHAYLKESKS